MIDGAYRAVAGDIVLRAAYDLAVDGKESPVSGDRLASIHAGITGFSVPQGVDLWSGVRA